MLLKPQVQTNVSTLKDKKTVGELQNVQDEANQAKNGIGNEVAQIDALDDLENGILDLEEEIGEIQPDEW